MAVTAGPGLIGGLLVGVATAKALALVHKLPLVAVNHLEAHALTVGLTEGLQPPYLLLLVSGGHTQLLVVHDVGRYQRLGTTIDDALGEAFDKTAKLLGLGFPGGPAVEAAARTGRAGPLRPAAADAGPAGAAFLLRRPQDRGPAPGAGAGAARREGRGRPVRRLRGGRGRQRGGPRAAGDGDRRGTRLGAGTQRHLVVAGGVAANMRLRAALAAVAADAGYQLHVPPPALCTDNAAMVAWAGAERLARGWTDGLDLEARARWPLDPDATPALGAGKHGAKA